MQLSPEKKQKILSAVSAFFMLWALMLTTGIPVRSFVTPLLYAALFCFLRLSRRVTADGVFAAGADRDKKAAAGHDRVMVCLTSVFFTLMVVLASYWEASAAFTSRIFRLSVLVILLAGWYLFFRTLLAVLFVRSETLRIRGSLIGQPSGAWSQHPAAVFHGRHLFAVTFAACFLSYLPWYLYSFPGIFSPDPINQIEQILGLVPLSNHHPVAHTAMIALFYHLTGLFTQDLTLRIGIYTLFQMTLFAFAAAAVVCTLRRVLGLKPLLCFFVFAFYAWIPFMAVFAVQVCKDTPFAAATMLFCCLLVRFVYEGLPFAAPSPDSRDHAQKGQGRTLSDVACTVAFILLGVLLSLLRTNGWYAFVFFAVFFVILGRRQLKRVLLLVLPVVALVLVIKGPVYDSMHVIRPDFAESLHIPMQQIAQVLVEHRELSAHDRDMIEAVIDTTYVDVLYIPGYADSFKELIRAGHPEILEAHKGEYLLLWLRLGLRYPADYLHAWAAQIRGVTWPEAACDVAIIEGVYPNGMGLDYHPLIGGPVLVKLRELVTRIGNFIPLYGLTWSMGAYCWLLLFAVSLILGQSDKKGRLLVLLPAAALFLTLLIATPIADEFRYAYPIVALAPFALCAWITSPCGGQGTYGDRQEYN